VRVISGSDKENVVTSQRLLYFLFFPAFLSSECLSINIFRHSQRVLFFSAVFFILLNTFSTRFFMCIFAALTARAIIFTALFVGETPWATFLCCLLLVHYQKIKKIKK